MDTEIILVIASSAFVFFLLLFLFNFVLKYQRKTIAFAKEKELMQATFSQTLLQSQLEIREQTLQHISTELHDNLGQVASLIKINLHTIEFNNTIKAIQKLEDTKELTRQLITDIKSLSVSLSTDRIVQTGFVPALEIEVERINKTEQFVAEFKQDGVIPNIEQDKAIILYRMSQEILNNIVKHSGAKNVSVNLSTTENLVKLAFSDNGKGFDVESKLIGNSGAGLGNLQKRATLITATISVQSVIGQGSKVTIELPHNYAPAPES